MKIYRFFALLVCFACVTYLRAIDIPFSKGVLSISFIDDNAARVQYHEHSISLLPDWIYVKPSIVKFKRKSVDSSILLTTDKMCVSVDTARLRVSFTNAAGKEIMCVNRIALLREESKNQSALRSTISISSPPEEYLYGLGQFQDGYVNLRGLSRRLTQVNTQISIPMLLSNRGYALLWNNYGLTEFNPADHQVALHRTDAEGTTEEVNVTSTSGGKKEMRTRNIYTANLDIPVTGTYSLLLDVGQKMARRHHLSIDGKSIFNIQSLWLPPTMSSIVTLSAGKHIVEAELEKGDNPILFYKDIDNQNVDKEHKTGYTNTVLSSPISSAVDFTVFIGKADEAIASYRRVTGNAPMMPKWAMGYIHCRERFHNQQELLSVAKKFRKRKLPIDVIVQDWQYWGKYGWNAMRFDESNYPDPKVMVDSLHQMNIRLMLSVWSKIDPSSDLGKQMAHEGHYIPGTQWIDFFSDDAAQAYWKHFSSGLLRPYHIDAWWQDATEPENDDLVGRMVMKGKYHGEIFRNVYPLLVNKTVYEGLRHDDAQRRAMILTRSGFPGIQRYGAAMWSGDVGHDWTTFKRQISAGLGMAAAGMPWWTYDAGGFFRPANQYTDSSYIECMLRWIQTSVYLPLMRVHGYMSDTEPWKYGEEAEAIIARCLRERYRLLPYIYSNAAEVSFQGSTIMRPLVFDFSTDTTALAQSTDYMFGKSLLVSPVTAKGVRSWPVYLPQNVGGWYDFYTGEWHEGGKWIMRSVDKQHIPVYAKAGSILPLAMAKESVMDTSLSPIELMIYPGADASFTLYDDSGTDYGYEKGEYSVIPMRWDNAQRYLIIEKRKGTYKGMTDKQIFIVKCKDKKMVIVYTGKRIKVRL